VIPSRIISHGPERPSQRELYKKLAEASSLIRAGKWFPANYDKLKPNFDDLERTFRIETTLVEDQTKVLVTALEEIRTEHYAGSRPPQKSYEPAAKGKDMFAFRWQSDFFTKTEMYLKFCLVGDDRNRQVCIFSIHEHKE